MKDITGNPIVEKNLVAERNLVFVYGTLRKGCHNNHCLGDAIFVGIAKTVEKYGFFLEPEYGISFAAKRKDGRVVNVVGEVYKVNDMTLRNLDTLEGHPEAYKRSLVQVDIEGNNGNSRKLAWMYLYPEERIYPQWRFIETGDYMKQK